MRAIRTNYQKRPVCPRFPSPVSPGHPPWSPVDKLLLDTIATAIREAITKTDGATAQNSPLGAKLALAEKNAANVRTACGTHHVASKRAATSDAI
jgi:hypothetical protein